jgi:DNA-binding YbaB/EbfC family protein
MLDKGLGAIFKQAREMQSRMAEMQNELARKTVEVSVGGGMVKMTANGLNEVLSVKIDADLINMRDREVLEDLLIGAVNELHRKVKNLAQEEMAKITGDLKIPGVFP